MKSLCVEKKIKKSLRSWKQCQKVDLIVSSLEWKFEARGTFKVQQRHFDRECKYSFRLKKKTRHHFIEAFRVYIMRLTLF
jgi:hypothetical protein